MPTAIKTIRVADDATIIMSIAATADGKFHAGVTLNGSQRMTSKPFGRHIPWSFSNCSYEVTVATVAAAREAAEQQMAIYRDDYLRAAAALSAQLAIDAANVAAAEAAWGE